MAAGRESKLCHSEASCITRGHFVKWYPLSLRSVTDIFTGFAKKTLMP